MITFEKEIIIKNLTNSLSELYEETTRCLKNLRQHHFKYEDNQRNFEKWLNYLESCRRLIRVHKDINRFELTDINLANEIQSYFIDKKYKKKVAFYVKKGVEGQRERIKDPNLLKEFFTIKDCLPIMHLVPMQIALNARKYMPKESTFEVELTITEERNFIVFSNIGPQCDLEEKKDITSPGTRGQNTVHYIGMGMGLSEVKEVIDIHKELLGTTLDIDSVSESVNFNGYRHSLFKAEITYQKQHSTSDIQPAIDNILLYLIHNSLDITNNLFDICDHLKNINEKINKEWREHVFRLRLFNNFLLKTVKECIFISNDEKIEDILGDDSILDIKSVFIAVTNELKKYLLPNITIDISGSLEPKYSKFQTVDGIRSFILSICELFMSQIQDGSTLELNFIDNQIMLKCEDLNSFDVFIYSEDCNYNQKTSFRMCNIFIQFYGGEIIIKNNSLIIILP